MRAKLITVATFTAASAASCFSIPALPDCASEDGLHIAYHVCMPPARAAIELPGEPQELVIGDFDGEGVDNDVAVLIDPSEVHVYSSLSQAEPNAVVRSFRQDVEVEGLIAARNVDGATGDDLLGWVVAEFPMVSELVILANGGDMFAGAPIQEPLAGCPIDELDCTPLPCYAPEQGVTLFNPESGLDDVLVLGCVPDAVAMGGPMGESASKLPDALIIAGPTSPLGAAKLTITDPNISFVGASRVVFFVEAEVAGFVFSHRPTPMDDAQISIADIETLTLFGGTTIEPGHKGIEDIQVADVDSDGDLDLLAVHIEDRGFSIIRQSEPAGPKQLVFAEPEFYTLGVESSAVALGDFTGDKVLDIAVGHSVDNETLDAISLFVLNPSDPTGLRPYASAPIGRISGTIVGLKTMDFDSDGLDDLVVSVRDGSKGRIEFYVSRPPGEQPAE